MKWILLLVALTELSSQSPLTQKARSLAPRSHPVSSQSTSLKRRPCQQPNTTESEGSTGSAPITDNNRQKYLAPITFGTQTLLAEIDTGSSDTWLIQTGFQCFQTFNSSTGSFQTPEDPSFCNFGPTYTPDADFTPLSDIEEFSCYGTSGENSLRCLSGEFGVAPVTFAGLTIPSQIVGAPINSSYPAKGAAEQSGIIGLAFNAATSAHSSTDGSAVQYNSIMTTLFEVDTFDPPLAKLFAIALSRDESGNGNGGILTVGGVPALDDPAVNVSSTSFSSAPFELVASLSATDYSFYSINADGFVLGDTSAGDSLQIIIDSGANTVSVTQATADYVNSNWLPAANVTTDGTAILDCDATLTAPFGVTIGGVTYYINPADMIGKDSASGLCFSLVSAGSEDEYLIGDPLLKNVLAVYNWDATSMEFYPRMEYES